MSELKKFDFEKWLSKYPNICAFSDESISIINKLEKACSEFYSEQLKALKEENRLLKINLQRHKDAINVLPATVNAIEQTDTLKLLLQEAVEILELSVDSDNSYFAKIRNKFLENDEIKKFDSNINQHSLLGYCEGCKYESLTSLGFTTDIPCLTCIRNNVTQNKDNFKKDGER